jgi:L-lactate dehydrogenase
VEAQVLGEHGTSAVFVWSSARVGGANLGPPLDSEEARKELESQVRFANITIIEGTGASSLGIGVVSSRITEMIVRDERAVIPLASWNPEHGVTLSVPSVVGREGVIRRLMPDLSATERQALEKSAEVLRSALKRIRV